MQPSFRITSAHLSSAALIVTSTGYPVDTALFSPGSRAGASGLPVRSHWCHMAQVHQGRCARPPAGLQPCSGPGFHSCARGSRARRGRQGPTGHLVLRLPWSPGASLAVPAVLSCPATPPSRCPLRPVQTSDLLLPRDCLCHTVARTGALSQSRTSARPSQTVCSGYPLAHSRALESRVCLFYSRARALPAQPWHHLAGSWAAAGAEHHRCGYRG